MCLGGRQKSGGGTGKQVLSKKKKKIDQSSLGWKKAHGGTIGSVEGNLEIGHVCY